MNTNQVTHEKSKRKSRRFKVLDAVIILLVILAVVGVYLRYNSLDFFENKLNMKEYTVSFSIDNIRSTTPDYIHPEDEVYFGDSGEFMGTIKPYSEDMKNIALKCTVASEYFSNGEGGFIEVNYPQDTRVRAEGKMLCRGVYTEDGSFLVDGSTYLASGKAISVKTDTVTFMIMIHSIEEVPVS